MKTFGRETIGKYYSQAISIGLVFSLLMGVLDIETVVVSGLFGFSLQSFLLLSFGVAVSAFFIIYIIIWFFALSHIGRHLKLDTVSLLLALTLFLQMSFTTASINSLFYIPLPLGCFSIVLLISLFFAMWAYWTVITSNKISINSFMLYETMVSFLFLYVFGKKNFFPIHPIIVSVCYIFTVAFMLCLRRYLYVMRSLSMLMGLIILGTVANWVFLKNTKYSSEKHKVKHVILITIDTLRHDALSCYEAKRSSTPEIEKFAKDGIIFENAFSSAPWTLPAITSIMTGLTPDVHSVIHLESRLSDNLPTLAEYMSDAGYFTSAIGWNVVLTPEHNMYQGFSEYNFFPLNSFSSKILRKIFSRKFASNSSTPTLTKLAIEWLGINHEKDFFLWIHYLDPHSPYTPPDEFIPKEDEHLAVSFPKGEREKKLYKGEVRYIDKHVGKLFSALKRLNIYDDSIIVLTSDHGEEFGEHGKWRHGHTLYNELIHVPLLIKLPLHDNPKRRINKAVSTQSIMPTILQLCGIDYKTANLSASSLSALWGNTPGAFKDKPIISTALMRDEERESIVIDSMKYIHFLRKNRKEVYDLANDSDEHFPILNPPKVKTIKVESILESYKKTVKRLRKYYNIPEGDKRIKLDREAVKHLKALGYL